MFVYYGFHHYFVSDLKLCLPPLEESNLPADANNTIRIRLHPAGKAAPQVSVNEQRLKEYVILNALDVGQFVVDHGKAVDIYPLPGVTDAILEMWVFGVVMSTLMYQRGFFTLHACAMRVGDKTVALIGNVGYGKSTLTASLLKRGHRFLADDLTALDFSLDYPCVLPGFPILKLSPEIADRTGFNHSQILGEHPYKGKSIYFVEPLVDEKPSRLDYLFLLECGELEFKTLSPMESFSQLNRNSLPTGRGGKSDRQHFERCMALCKNVPFMIYRRPFNLDDLGEQARYLEEFLATRGHQSEITETPHVCVTQ